MWAEPYLGLEVNGLADTKLLPLLAFGSAPTGRSAALALTVPRLISSICPHHISIMSSTPSDPQAAALLAHVLAQTRENVNFLASHNYISPADATDISRRLSNSRNSDSLQSSMQALSVVGPTRDSAPSPMRRPVPAFPSRVQRARALWAYNENGQVSVVVVDLCGLLTLFGSQERNDLSFSAGEIIEVIDETNSDWWTGKCRGRQGLFPSNYVEKMDSIPPNPEPVPAMPTAPAAPMQMGPSPYPSSSMSEKLVYQPYPGPVAPINSQPVVVQQQQQQEPPKKPSRFSGLGNTVNLFASINRHGFRLIDVSFQMANSAAGGVGFGAGNHAFNIIQYFSDFDFQEPQLVVALLMPFSNKVIHMCIYTSLLLYGQ